MPNLLRRCLLLILAAGLSLQPLSADTLYMHDGRTIEGKIVAKTAEGFVVEIASGAKTIRVLYKFADVREVAMNPVTANDQLMAEYHQRLVAAAADGADGYRDLARWCARSDALGAERKSAWRAVLGLLPDDEEAHGALGLVKAADGGWQSIDEKMAANGFVRQGNTWVRAGHAAAANQPPQPAPAAVASNSVLERSGFNQLYGGATGYTAEVSGPGIESGTLFYGRSGYPYLSVYDAAGLGIYVPLHSYTGAYYLALPPINYSGPPARGMAANLTLAQRNLTGPMFPTAPATTTVTQNGTTFEAPSPNPQPPSTQTNSQGYDQNGFKTGPGYREPTPPAVYTPTGRDNLQVIDENGVVTYQGANYETHTAMGYNQHGFRYSPAKVAQDASGVITNSAGYTTHGYYVGPSIRGTQTPYAVNGAGYTTQGVYTGPQYAPVTVFLVNGAGYSTNGTMVSPFYSQSGAVYGGYSRPTPFVVDLYGSARGTQYRFGVSPYGVSFDLNGKKGDTAWSVSFH